MAIKTSITSTINGFITAIVTVAKLRSAFDTLLNNVYPTPLVDTHLTTNVITAFGSNYEYELTFTKIGRLVHVNGYITNVSGLILDIEDIATISNTEFRPFASFLLLGQNENNQNLLIEVGTDFLAINSTFGVGQTFFINQSYPVNE